MKLNPNPYSLLAGIFEYPDCDFPLAAGLVQDFLDAKYPKAAIHFKHYSTVASSASLNEMEELFTRSFDVQAVTTLDLGYVLFGDDYKRGELLVNLNREHREVGNECFSELSDHLPNVLRLLPKMKDKAIVEELVQKVLAPSLKKMIEAFDPEKIEAKDKVYRKHHKTIIEKSEQYYRIYRKPLQALLEVLKNDFVIIEREPREQDF